MNAKTALLGVLFFGVVLMLLRGGLRRTRVQLLRHDEINTDPEATTDHEDAHEEEETVVAGWQTMTATVTDVRANGMWLQLENGETVRVRRQPWLFAETQGFEARAGDAMRVHGYGEGAGFEVGALENLTSGQQVRLRDENGRSLWSAHANED